MLEKCLWGGGVRLPYKYFTSFQVLLISHLKIIINLMFRFNKHVLYLIELATPLSKSNRVNESYV